jgi:7-cyano-7-deazaguanine synthase
MSGDADCDDMSESLDDRTTTAVLFSAGLDSAVLVAEEARRAPVYPLYISVGLAWEQAELAMAAQLLRSPAFGDAVRPLTTLHFTMRDVYPPTHWAVQGTPPTYDTPDEDVYLTGRNLVLLAKAGTWCAQHRVSRIALAPLAGNPFPDATPEFFAAMADALAIGLAHPLAIVTPFRELEKEEVIARGATMGVPFELTLSCMNPMPAGLSEGGPPYRHCGACSKCRERQDAFRRAGLDDPAPYVTNRDA